jgi:hypothetical protein
MRSEGARDELVDEPGRRQLGLPFARGEDLVEASLVVVVSVDGRVVNASDIDDDVALFESSRVPTSNDS